VREPSLTNHGHFAALFHGLGSSYWHRLFLLRPPHPNPLPQIVRENIDGHGTSTCAHNLGERGLRCPPDCQGTRLRLPQKYGVVPTSHEATRGVSCLCGTTSLTDHAILLRPFGPGNRGAPGWRWSTLDHTAARQTQVDVYPRQRTLFFTFARITTAAHSAFLIAAAPDRRSGWSLWLVGTL
jgi:hypothetical protein